MLTKPSWYLVYKVSSLTNESENYFLRGQGILVYSSDPSKRDSSISIGIAGKNMMANSWLDFLASRGF